MFPGPSTASPAGAPKSAALPAPSAVPERSPVPASVVTTPPVAILRIVWLPVSATRSVPPGPCATPFGERKRAAGPVPSAAPGFPLLPAYAVTKSEAIFRTWSLPESAT